jgi:hypothetical protein
MARVREWYPQCSMNRPRPICKHSRSVLFCVAVGLLLAASVSFGEAAGPKTDSETLKLLKQWDGDDEAPLATLFATGQSREPELAKVCHNEDQELHAKAYVVLLIIGSTATADCANNLNVEGESPMLLSGDIITGADLDRLEKLIVENPCKDDRGCKKQDDDCPQIDESIGYALVLNGSNRAFTLAKRIATLFKACRGEGLMAAEPFLKTESMWDARSKTRNLRLAPANFEAAMKQSAFFVPEDRQKEVSVELLARNETNSRMLVEVSYRCGMLCGSGYYVVLKKNAAGTWDYVLVSRAWIS